MKDILKQRLLSSIENHGKMLINGLLKLYPDYSPFTVHRSLLELQNEGWLIIRKNMTIDGIKTYNPNVRRSTKQLYSQPQLFQS